MPFAALLRAPLSPTAAAAAADRRPPTTRSPTVLDTTALDLRRPRRGCVAMSATGERNLAQFMGTSNDHFDITKDIKVTEHPFDNDHERNEPFTDIKRRFLDFKRRSFVGNPENYQKLAEKQEPQFLVIACADSRVCPSDILGFQPGEAFTVRNIANLIPPFEHGPSETKAALEFAVTNLEVENVLVMGHGQCGGIQALMRLKLEADTEAPRSFIRDWVLTAKDARLSTQAAAGNLSFELQCKHCEKESINGSLLNLLTYPWIEQRFIEGKLALHGGYYNIVDCTFEKWTLVHREGSEGGGKYTIENRSFWS